MKKSNGHPGVAKSFSAHVERCQNDVEFAHRVAVEEDWARSAMRRQDNGGKAFSSFESYGIRGAKN